MKRFEGEPHLFMHMDEALSQVYIEMLVREVKHDLTWARLDISGMDLNVEHGEEAAW